MNTENAYVKIEGHRPNDIGAVHGVVFNETEGKKELFLLLSTQIKKFSFNR